MIEFHRSANKHGVPELDVLHAISHPQVVEPEPDSDPPRILIIGPDRAGNLLEVVLLEMADNLQLIIHAMKLRTQFNDLLPGERGTP